MSESAPPSARGPLLAVAAVVLVALLGGLFLVWSWPDDGSWSSGPPATEVGEPLATPEEPPVAAATAVLRAWSRPGLDYPWWWDGLEPLLSPGAQAAYAHTDPDRLPALGELRPVASEHDGRTATVWFRTDAGRYGVDLAQAADDGQWRAHRILFPGQESMFR